MNIRLRRTLEADLDFVLALEGNPENSSFILRWERERHAEALYLEDLKHLIIESAEAVRPVGFVILAGIQDPHQSVELRRVVVSERGKGYGAAALSLIKQLVFEQLGAHRLWLDVKKENVRARQVYKSAGFIEEGVIRECLKSQHGFESLVLMSILDYEYKPTVAAKL